MENAKKYLFYHGYYNGEKTTYIQCFGGAKTNNDHVLCDNVTFEVRMLENGESENFIICSSFLRVSNSGSFEMGKWGWGKTNGVVRVKNIQPRIFRDLLQYILKGFQWKYAGNYCDDILLLQAAHLFGYPALVRLISTALSSSSSDDGVGKKLRFMTAGTICDVFEKVFQAGEDAKAIMSKIEEFIIQNTSSVLETDGFRRLSSPALQHILTRENLTVKCELELFYAILEWGSAEFAKEIQSEVKNPRGLRSIVLPPLRLLQYAQMTKKEIEKVVVPAFQDVFNCGAARLGIQLPFKIKGSKGDSSYVRRNYSAPGHRHKLNRDRARLIEDLKILNDASSSIVTMSPSPAKEEAAKKTKGPSGEPLFPIIKSLLQTITPDKEMSTMLKANKKKEAQRGARSLKRKMEIQEQVAKLLQVKVIPSFRDIPEDKRIASSKLKRPFPEDLDDQEWTLYKSSNRRSAIATGSPLWSFAELERKKKNKSIKLYRVTLKIRKISVRRKKSRGKANAFAWRPRGPNRLQNAITEEYRSVGNIYYTNPLAAAWINRRIIRVEHEKPARSKRPPEVRPPSLPSSSKRKHLAAPKKRKVRRGRNGRRSGKKSRKEEDPTVSQTSRDETVAHVPLDSIRVGKFFNAVEICSSGNSPFGGKVASFFAQHARDLINTQDFEKLSRAGIKFLMSTPSMVLVSERDLFEALLRWAKWQCLKDHPRIFPDVTKRFLCAPMDLLNFFKLRSYDLSVYFQFICKKHKKALKSEDNGRQETRAKPRIYTTEACIPRLTGEKLERFFQNLPLSSLAEGAEDNNNPVVLARGGGQSSYQSNRMGKGPGNKVWSRNQWIWESAVPSIPNKKDLKGVEAKRTRKGTPENASPPPPPPLSPSDIKEAFRQVGVRKPKLLEGILDAGLKYPSWIQSGAVQVIRDGSNTVVEPPAGADEIAAFLIAIIQNIDSQNPHCQVLVLAPTQILATLIQDVVKPLATPSRITSRACFGGEFGTKIKDEMRLIEEGVQLVVGTPGRLWDLMERKNLSTLYIDVLVLIEANAMLSNGFTEQVQKIVARLKPHIQFILLPGSMEHSGVTDFITAYEENAGKTPIPLDANKCSFGCSSSTLQFYVNTESEELKVTTLVDLFRFLPTTRAVVRTSSPDNVKRLEHELRKHRVDWPVFVLPEVRVSSLVQDVVKRFLRDNMGMLLVADNQIFESHSSSLPPVLINFDLPPFDDFQSLGAVVGGKRVVVINFVVPEQVVVLEDLSESYGIEFQEMPNNISDYF